MSAAHVRRGGARPRKSAKVSVPKKIAKRLPVDHRRANKLAGLVFAAFLLLFDLVMPPLTFFKLGVCAVGLFAIGFAWFKRARNRRYRQT